MNNRNLAIEEVKAVISDFIDLAEHGIFDTRNIMGDRMSTLYSANGIQVDICFDYEYFEVLGVSKEEFKDIKEFYDVRLKEKASE